MGKEAMTRGAFAIARGNLLDKKKKKTERSAHGHRVLHPLNLPASPFFFFNKADVLASLPLRVSVLPCCTEVLSDVRVRGKTAFLLFFLL